MKIKVCKSKQAEHEITSLDVQYISLVKSPANQFDILLKSGGTVTEVPILKMDEVTKTVYGIVYAPDVVDSQGDFAKAEVIKAAAYNFMRNSLLKNVDREHNFNPTGACVVESWIVRGNDALFPANAGAWAVGLHVDDAALWGAIKSGEIKGLSLAGMAEKQAVEKAEKDTGVWLDLIKKIINIKGDLGMATEKKEEKKEDVKKEDGTAPAPAPDAAAYMEELMTAVAAITEEVKKLKEQMAGMQKSINSRETKADSEKEKESAVYKGIAGRG